MDVHCPWNNGTVYEQPREPCLSFKPETDFAEYNRLLERQVRMQLHGGRYNEEASDLRASYKQVCECQGRGRCDLCSRDIYVHSRANSETDYESDHELDINYCESDEQYEDVDSEGNFYFKSSETERDSLARVNKVQVHDAKCNVSVRLTEAVVNHTEIEKQKQTKNSNSITHEKRLNHIHCDRAARNRTLPGWRKAAAGTRLVEANGASDTLNAMHARYQRLTTKMAVAGFMFDDYEVMSGNRDQCSKSNSSVQSECEIAYEDTTLEDNSTDSSRYSLSGYASVQPSSPQVVHVSATNSCQAIPGSHRVDQQEFKNLSQIEMQYSKQAEKQNSKQAEQDSQQAEKQNTKQAEQNSQQAGKQNIKQAEQNSQQAEKQNIKQAEQNSQQAEKQNTKQAEQNSQQAGKQNIKQAEQNSQQAEKQNIKQAEQNSQQAEKQNIKQAEQNSQQAEKQNIKQAEQDSQQAEKQYSKQTEKQKSKQDEQQKSKQDEQQKSKQSEQQKSKQDEQQKSKQSEQQKSKQDEQQKSKQSEQQKSKQAEQQNNEQSEQQKSKQAEQQKPKQVEQQKSKQTKQRNFKTLYEMRNIPNINRHSDIAAGDFGHNDSSGPRKLKETSGKFNPYLDGMGEVYFIKKSKDGQAVPHLDKVSKCCEGNERIADVKKIICVNEKDGIKTNEHVKNLIQPCSEPADSTIVSAHYDSFSMMPNCLHPGELKEKGNVTQSPKPRKTIQLSSDKNNHASKFDRNQNMSAEDSMSQTNGSTTNVDSQQNQHTANSQQHKNEISSDKKRIDEDKKSFQFRSEAPQSMLNNSLHMKGYHQAEVSVKQSNSHNVKVDTSSASLNCGLCGETGNGLSGSLASSHFSSVRNENVPTLKDESASCESKLGKSYRKHYRDVTISCTKDASSHPKEPLCGEKCHEVTGECNISNIENDLSITVYFNEESTTTGSDSHQTCTLSDEYNYCATNASSFDEKGDSLSKIPILSKDGSKVQIGEESFDQRNQSVSLKRIEETMKTQSSGQCEDKSCDNNLISYSNQQTYPIQSRILEKEYRMVAQSAAKSILGELPIKDNQNYLRDMASKWDQNNISMIPNTRKMSGFSPAQGSALQDLSSVSHLSMNKTHNGEPNFVEIKKCGASETENVEKVTVCTKQFSEKSKAPSDTGKESILQEDIGTKEAIRVSREDLVPISVTKTPEVYNNTDSGNTRLGNGVSISSVSESTIKQQRLGTSDYTVTSLVHNAKVFNDRSDKGLLCNIRDLVRKSPAEVSLNGTLNVKDDDLTLRRNKIRDQPVSDCTCQLEDNSIMAVKGGEDLQNAETCKTTPSTVSLDVGHNSLTAPNNTPCEGSSNTSQGAFDKMLHYGNETVPHQCNAGATSAAATDMNVNDEDVDITWQRLLNTNGSQVRSPRPRYYYSGPLLVPSFVKRAASHKRPKAKNNNRKELYGETKEAVVPSKNFNVRVSGSKVQLSTKPRPTNKIVYCKSHLSSAYNKPIKETIPSNKCVPKKPLPQTGQENIGLSTSKSGYIFDNKKLRGTLSGKKAACEKSGVYSPEARNQSTVRASQLDNKKSLQNSKSSNYYFQLRSNRSTYGRLKAETVVLPKACKHGQTLRKRQTIAGDIEQNISHENTICKFNATVPSNKTYKTDNPSRDTTINRKDTNFTRKVQNRVKNVSNLYLATEHSDDTCQILSLPYVAQTRGVKRQTLREISDINNSSSLIYHCERSCGEFIVHDKDLDFIYQDHYTAVREYDLSHCSIECNISNNALENEDEESCLCEFSAQGIFGNNQSYKVRYTQLSNSEAGEYGQSYPYEHLENGIHIKHGERLESERFGLNVDMAKRQIVKSNSSEIWKDVNQNQQTTTTANKPNSSHLASYAFLKTRALGKVRPIRAQMEVHSEPSAAESKALFYEMAQIARGEIHWYMDIFRNSQHADLSVLHQKGINNRNTSQTDKHLYLSKPFASSQRSFLPKFIGECDSGEDSCGSRHKSIQSTFEKDTNNSMSGCLWDNENRGTKKGLDSTDCTSKHAQPRNLVSNKSPLVKNKKTCYRASRIPIRIALRSNPSDTEAQMNSNTQISRGKNTKRCENITEEKVIVEENGSRYYEQEMYVQDLPTSALNGNTMVVEICIDCPPTALLSTSDQTQGKGDSLVQGPMIKTDCPVQTYKTSSKLPIRLNSNKEISGRTCSNSEVPCQRNDVKTSEVCSSDHRDEDSRRREFSIRQHSEEETCKVHIDKRSLRSKNNGGYVDILRKRKGQHNVSDARCLVSRRNKEQRAKRQQSSKRTNCQGGQYKELQKSHHDLSKSYKQVGNQLSQNKPPNPVKSNETKRFSNVCVIPSSQRRGKNATKHCNRTAASKHVKNSPNTRRTLPNKHQTLARHQVSNRDGIVEERCPKKPRPPASLLSRCQLFSSNSVRSGSTESLRHSPMTRDKAFESATTGRRGTLQKAPTAKHLANKGNCLNFKHSIHNKEVESLSEKRINCQMRSSTMCKNHDKFILCTSSKCIKAKARPSEKSKLTNIKKQPKLKSTFGGFGDANESKCSWDKSKPAHVQNNKPSSATHVTTHTIKDEDVNEEGYKIMRKKRPRPVNNSGILKADLPSSTNKSGLSGTENKVNDSNQTRIELKTGRLSEHLSDLDNSSASRDLKPVQELSVHLQQKCQVAHQSNKNHPEIPPITQSPPQNFREKPVKPKGVPFDKFALSSCESSVVSERRCCDEILPKPSTNGSSKARPLHGRELEEAREDIMAISYFCINRPKASNACENWGVSGTHATLPEPPRRSSHEMTYTIDSGDKDEGDTCSSGLFKIPDDPLMSQNEIVKSLDLKNPLGRQQHTLSIQHSPQRVVPKQPSCITPEQITPGTSADATLKNIPTLVNEIVSENNIENISQNKALQAIEKIPKYGQSSLRWRPSCRVTAQMSKTPRRGKVTLAGLNNSTTYADESFGFSLPQGDSFCSSDNEGCGNSCGFYFSNLSHVTPRRNERSSSTGTSQTLRTSSQSIEVGGRGGEEEEEEESCCILKSNGSGNKYEAKVEGSNCEPPIGFNVYNAIDDVNINERRGTPEGKQSTSEEIRLTEHVGKVQGKVSKDPEKSPNPLPRHKDGRTSKTRPLSSHEILPPLSKRQIGLPHKEKFRRYY